MESEFLQGIRLSLIGIGVVACVLGVLIFSVQIMKYFSRFQKQEKSREDKSSPKKEADDTGELLASAPPDEVLAVVAVERHRRQKTLGDRLKMNATHKYPTKRKF